MLNRVVRDCPVVKCPEYTAAASQKVSFSSCIVVRVASSLGGYLERNSETATLLLLRL